MRALITGASGFVGCHLVEHLAAEGDIVVGISASGRWPAPARHLERLARLEAFDLVDSSEDELVDLLRRKRPDAIYHLAAQSNPRQSVDDPRGAWALNLGGSLNLLEAVRQARPGEGPDEKSGGGSGSVGGSGGGGACAPETGPRVVLVGTGTAYGDPAPEHVPVNEDCPLRPNNPYAASKAAVDLLGVQHYLGNGTNVVIARPFNHAGPRQSPRYVLAALARQVAEVEAGRLDAVAVGNLEVVRDFTDVRDVVRAYRLLAQTGQPGTIYNVGSGRGTKIADALEHLRSLARKPVPVRVDPARVRPVDLPMLVADATRLRQATGWRPRFSMEQTLADMLEWFRNEP